MTTIRVAKRRRYTSLDRDTVNDGRLSYRARGVLAWILDKPDDWTTDSTAIARATDGEGRDAIRAALRELEAVGYVVRAKVQDDAGHWITETTVYERPPATETQAPENRAPVDPPPAPGSQASENRAPDSQALTPLTLIQTTETDAPAAAGAGEDDVVEALIEALPVAPITDIEKRRVLNAARQLLDVGVVPADIGPAAQRYRELWPRAQLTAHALAANWSLICASIVDPTAKVAGGPARPGGEPTCELCAGSAWTFTPDAGDVVPCPLCNPTAQEVPEP